MKTNRFNLIGIKIKIAGAIAMVAIFSSCNNSQLVQQYKTLHEHDSLLVLQTQAEDSTIKGYINSMNEIQSNLDEIKSREKILSVNGNVESKTGNNAVNDIKMLDSLIIASNKNVAALRARVKKMDKKNVALEAMITRMTAQIAAQDTQITVLQSSLAKVNDSYKQVTQQFNDSMVVLQNRNTDIENLTNTMNTVYYAVGTLKELKDNKVIDKTGGFIGIGRNSQLKPDFNSSYFTKTDLTKLQVIPLNAKFKKLLTTHPVDSYKISGNKTADSLWITDQSSFWKENKYLVVAVK
ncbi:MAG TPA: hypothetical protein VK808_04610 [Bacteroidia bacterium]|nr:hypothetical protein [Bacteroidia bacterium]